VPGSGNNSKIGDHIVVLDLKVPSELDEETRRIFE
jgi:hypothetical protein